MRRPVLATALAALGLAAAAAPAPAVIQLERGIAGARLGNTVEQVRAALGPPSRTVTGENAFGPFTELRYPGGLRVGLQGGERVTRVSTTGLGDRTTSGVGVGSSERTLRARVPRVRCATEQGFRLCTRGRLAPGQRVTTFRIRGGRVTEVDVGLVID